MKKLFLTLAAILCISILDAQDSISAKSWSWSLDEKTDTLSVTLEVPPGFYAYSSGTRPLLKPELKSLTKPETESYKDPIGDTKSVYKGPGEYTWTYSVDKTSFPLELAVEFESCDNFVCHLPEKLVLTSFKTPSDVNTHMASPQEEEPLPDAFMLPDYTVIKTGTGYMDAGNFTAFLTGSTDNAAVKEETRSLAAMLLAALFGGLLLNLTPCVLPLIPVNLAVIGGFGTNTKAGRMAGGIIYGSGIAVTYGLIGVFAAVTGQAFGSINSSWIFNGIAGVIFIFLAIAMFGFVNLDFSSLNSKIRIPRSAGYAGVFALGALSAILAGACVAPVLVATLVYAATLYQQGSYAGLALPFALGIGMALPWPFMAAGLALMPKPGKWMVYVKYILGALIAVLGIYYIYTAFSIRASAANETVTAEKNLENIRTALEESKKTGKHVLLDFWATWCKNCSAMELKTFKNESVKRALESYIFVRVQAEDMDDPATKALLKTMNVKGLPTFIVLKAE